MRQTILRTPRTGFVVMLGVITTSAAIAMNSDTPTAPYQGIVERNVFHLRALAVPTAETLTLPITLPKITLTGITTILGRRIAFITITGSKPGELPYSWMLAEGQGANEIEVIKIDEKAGAVEISNHRQLQNLDFDHDGGFSGPPTIICHAPPPTGPIPLPQSVSPVGGPLSAEEQVALIEIQRAKYQQENNPVHQIFPPTVMSEETDTSPR